MSEHYPAPSGAAQPITPPPELRRLWAQQAQRMDPRDPVAWQEHVATQAARWGSDQELEACVQYFHEYDSSWGEDSELISGLRAARRPKPPSLKEQALQALAEIAAECYGNTDKPDTIRRALEALPE